MYERGYANVMQDGINLWMMMRKAKRKRRRRRREFEIRKVDYLSHVMEKSMTLSITRRGKVHNGWLAIYWLFTGYSLAIHY